MREIIGIDGKKLTVSGGFNNVPQQPGSFIVVSGEGMPIKTGGRGDLLAEVKVELPKKLNDEQKAAFKNLL